jgi:hypothetical protein
MDFKRGWALNIEVRLMRMGKWRGMPELIGCGEKSSSEIRSF